MEALQVVAFTHKKIEIKQLGKLFLSEESQLKLFHDFKKHFGFNEFMLLNTCNRVELIFVHDDEILKEKTCEILAFLFPEMDDKTLNHLTENAEYFSGEEAVNHLFSVSSGLDSMVVGEREIITQIRKAYEQCMKMRLTGDTIRIVIQQAIITAKEIYSRTDIAKNPVSIVSLAYRKLKEYQVPKNARFILVGAGETIGNMAKYLKKHQYANFYIFNRTLKNAESLAKDLDGKAFYINDLKKHQSGFDVLITCTSSPTPIITREIYSSIIGADKSKKIIIDLAVPGDVDEKVIANFDLNFVAVSTLQELAKINRGKREKEMEKCKAILENRVIEFRQLYKERTLEIALSELPKRVKEIRETAVNEVFAKQLKDVDDNSRKLIDDLIAYMEKKYNAIAMKTAKESLLEYRHSKKN